MKKVSKYLLQSFCLFLLTAATVSAQSGVGKLAGKIVDATTGEPLIGANVVVINTEHGAATDLEGNYFVLNITPGTYNVRVSYVGYGSKTVQDVRIVGGITYELNVQLTGGLNLNEIVVTDSKFFEEKATNTVKVIDSDQISKLPVKGVTNIASLQSGVVKTEGSGGADGNATLNVRGGRGNEVLYIVDGIPQNNVLSGNSAAQVSDAAIEQMSFQVGGYEAKYGQAQSGIINVTTKSGAPTYAIMADAVTSSWTDKFGYNLYSGNLSGPFIPGDARHTFFLSAERGWFLDAEPNAIPIEFESIGKTYDVHPNNSAGVWRFTGRTYHSFGDFTVRLGANVNTREGRMYTHRYAKNNAEFMPAFEQNNYSYSAKVSQTLSKNTFWNLTGGFRRYYYSQFDPHMKDNLFLYGNKEYMKNTFGVTISANGQRILEDANGIFYGYGRVNNAYTKNENDVYSADFDFTSQQKSHLLEFGGGVSYNLVRYYSIAPIGLSSDVYVDKTEEQIFEDMQPTVFGYDVTGRSKTGTNYSDKGLRPKTPVFAYTYIQDRYELEDLVLNLGVRVDYFDTQADELINPSLPYAGGSNPKDFDDGDFRTKKAEVLVSPRIGLGFPVTNTTVFHAQIGRFVQQPALTDVYAGKYDLLQFKSMSPQYVQNASIKSEETIQYEVGFRQILGEVAALNITAFYKNIKGLVNQQNNYFQRVPGGQTIAYIAPTNSDFGTTKGLAFSFDLSRLGYFSLSAQYTYSIAEGTGSSTSSSFTAVFRNNDNAAPKVIAPLDFDQRHTGVINLDFSVPQGDLGFLEMFSANMLISFNSGRPYTPVDYYNILASTDGGFSTTGYVNSRYAPGSFKVDLKVEKTFAIGNLRLSPYVWIENLFDADNVTDVYRSTGDAYTTGFLNTAQGKSLIALNGEGYRQDYTSLERDPANFGIPRLIKLGLRVNFTNITL